jgi:hypothetical protein
MAEETAPRRGRQLMGLLGFVLHVAVAVFPYAASGLLAPAWGYVVLYGVWLGLLVYGLVLFRTRRERAVLLVPVLALAFWFVFMTFGDFVLGWTA